MATVTGLTAERMLEIEAASVVDGAIVGDDLILTKHDTSTINAGNVRGPEGPVGPAGVDADPNGFSPLFYDDFSTDLSNWTIDSGAGTLSAAGGLLTVSSLADKILRPTGISFVDGRILMASKFATAAGFMELRLKYLSAGNYLSLELLQNGNWWLAHFDDGTESVMSSGNIGGLSPGEWFWHSVAVAGDDFILQRFNRDPRTGVAQEQQQTVRLPTAGGVRTKFGSGVSGGAQLRLTPGNVGDVFDDFVVQQAPGFDHLT